MATATISFAAGTEAGAGLRGLALAISQLAMAVPDRHPGGPPVTLAINDAPGGGAQCSITLGGPYVPSGAPNPMRIAV
jgi:hypothetical protein